MSIENDSMGIEEHCKDTEYEDSANRFIKWAFKCAEDRDKLLFEKQTLIKAIKLINEKQSR